MMQYLITVIVVLLISFFSGLVIGVVADEEDPDERAREDRDQIEHLSEALPPQVLIVEGDGTDSSVQLDAGVDDADLFVALMGHDETNLVACEIAMTNFQVPRCIATVNSPKNEEIFTAVGIEPVSYTKIIASIIEEELDITTLL